MEFMTNWYLSLSLRLSLYKQNHTVKYKVCTETALVEYYGGVFTYIVGEINTFLMIHRDNWI